MYMFLKHKLAIKKKEVVVLLYSSIKLEIKHNPILKYNLYCQEHINELIDTSSRLDIVLLDFLNTNLNSSFPFSSDLIASCYMNLSAIVENELSISTTVTSPYILEYRVTKKGRLYLGKTVCLEWFKR